MSDPRGITRVLCQLESEFKAVSAVLSQHLTREAPAWPYAARCCPLQAVREHSPSTPGLQALSLCRRKGGFSSPKVVRAANSP